MQPSLGGRTALVTGGGTGIGRETALALGRAGARVAICGRRPEPLRGVVRELEAIDTPALAVPADVRDTASIQGLVGTVERELGAVDILVNNAAAFARGDVVSIPLERWNDVIATNLTGAFQVTRAVLPGMIRRRAGSIVFVSSTSGKRGDAGGSAYSASKFGVMGLAHSLLNEVRRHDIRVIVVSPSGIDTRPEAPDPERVTGVKPHASDVAASIVHCLLLPPRVLVREVEIWGTNPSG
jgi:NAD(P)-dependent dehydrogenase (short-subunit alcohol dehydrogenase family)